MKRLMRKFDDEKRMPAKQDGPATFVLRIIETAYEPVCYEVVLAEMPRKGAVAHFGLGPWKRQLVVPEGADLVGDGGGLLAPCLG